jgi:hypothetical protein
MTLPVAIRSSVAARVTPRARKSDRVFFTTMAVAMTAGVFAGFGRTYAHRIAAGTTTPLIHIHGAVFAAWMIFFVAQTTLVAAGRTRLHRQLGVAGAFLAALMVVVGTVTGVVAARHGYHGPNPNDVSALSFLLFAPLRDMLVFGSLTGAAIVLRRELESHKRLMVMATLGGLAPAGFVRIAGDAVGIAVILTLLIAGPVYDWLVHRRLYGAYLWGIAVTILSSAVFEALADGATWQAFARTLVE